MRLNHCILDLVPSSIAVLNRDGTIIAVNEPWRRFALENGPQPGTPAPNTGIGVNYLDACRQAAADADTAASGAARDGIRAVLEGRLPHFSMEYPCRWPDGQRWFTMSVTPLDGEDEKLVVIHTDVTNRERSALQARASEHLFRSVFEASLDAVLVVTPAGGILAANSTAQKMFGFSEDELCRRGWLGLIDTGDQRVTAAFSQLGASGQFSGELTFIDRDDRRFPVELSSSEFAGSDGKRMTSIIVRDISERKQFEAQLIASRKRYLALFRDATDAIAIAGPDGRLEEVNARFVALLGYAEHELRGMSIERLHPVGELPRIREHFARIFDSGSSDSLETLVLRHDGREVEVEIRPTLIELGDHVVAQGIVIDLTERKRLEQQRIDQERLQRNALVREVHHRIKNNLQSVSGLLQRELGSFLELNPRLHAAISQVNAIAVVHGLQSEDPDEAIRLCDSIRNICRTVAELSLRPLHFAIENEATTFRAVQIANDEAVSVALVLNELTLNAVKHSPPDGFIPSVSLTADGNCATVLIRNAVRHRPDFDIASGSGLGTGLRLVRSLLPYQGAHLSYEQEGEYVLLTRLRLAEPAITPCRPRQDA